MSKKPRKPRKPKPPEMIPISDDAQANLFNDPQSGRFAATDDSVSAPDPLYPTPDPEDNTNPNAQDPAVVGRALSGVFFGAGTGVTGSSRAGYGVYGRTGDGALAAIHGVGGQNGVWGKSSDRSGSGVWGWNTGGGYGVTGHSTDGWGIYASSAQSILADGDVQINGRLFVGNENTRPDVTLFGKVSHKGEVEVDGNLTVHADVLLLNGHDVAEHFPVKEEAPCKPGSVMVICQDGKLRPCSQEYDRRAIGVIAGAGSSRPAVLLGHGCAAGRTAPVSLVGTAFCLVDADQTPVQVGDLLTSSSTPGHAMKAADPQRSAGAVIGKSLAALARGRELVPMLIVLR